MPNKCPTCGCDKSNYFTIYLKGGWKVMFQCGHFFSSTAVPRAKEPTA